MFEGHGLRKSAWFPPRHSSLVGPSSSSLPSVCTHLLQHGGFGGWVMPMYSQPEFLNRHKYKKEALKLDYFVGLISNQSFWDWTWALRPPSWLLGFIGVHLCRNRCMFVLPGLSLWMLSLLFIFFWRSLSLLGFGVTSVYQLTTLECKENKRTIKSHQKFRVLVKVHTQDMLHSCFIRQKSPKNKLKY